MILYFIRGNTFFIINDSLVKDINTGTPIKYSSKVFTVPHLDCFIFGIGVSEFTKSYYDQMLNVVSDNIDYIKQVSERICISSYYSLKLHEQKIFSKVFFIKRIEEKIHFLSFCSDDNFKPKITSEAIGFFPQNQRISLLLQDEINQESIEVKNIFNILEENESEIDSGGEYFLHMFSGDNSFLISKLGKSKNYKKQLQEMIGNCALIGELKGKTFYFDQNIWGNLLDNIQKNDFEIVSDLIDKISQNKISIAYSSVNIKETLRRSIETNILEELSLVKKITNNIYLSPDFKFGLKDPFEVYREQKINDPVVDTLIKSFQDNINELIESNSDDDVKNQLLESKILNNIHSSEIFDFLDNQFKNIGNQNVVDTEDILNPSIKVFYEKTMDMIVNFLEESFSSIDGFDTESLITKVKEEMIKKGDDILKQDIKKSTVKPTNIDTLFKNLGYQEELLPGLMNGFLEASNYHPDSKKLKKKKGVKIDDDDMSHVNYCTFFDYFITEDTKLIKRISAVKEKLNISTEVLRMDEFVELLKSIK